ncbi:unnamed protein product [Phaedon cochleariae]|uniref:Reelin domain-containing protein n=1 Tax=Phaedon cochleariae TaxID=80249 RepID=A0A9P0DZE7_PHACE|nr:unnamed protein product [Phaedon cochleariae]
MFKLLVISCLVACAYGNSAGAPEDSCDDMTPKHPADPQKSPFPYKVTVNRNQVRAGENVEITVGGGRTFKGFLLQVRGGNKAVGQFQNGGGDKYWKTIKCHDNDKSTATHKNATEKKNLKLIWKAPSAPGKYTVYATVAQDGGTFWAYHPTETINVVA